MTFSFQPWHPWLYMCDPLPWGQAGSRSAQSVSAVSSGQGYPTLRYPSAREWIIQMWLRWHPEIVGPPYMANSGTLKVGVWGQEWTYMDQGKLEGLGAGEMRGLRACFRGFHCQVLSTVLARALLGIWEGDKIQIGMFLSFPYSWPLRL